MSRLFWLSDDAWAAIEPHLPKNQPGARRVDDRRVISGILHGLKTGCCWKDCPAQYGPPTTIYNRFNRWSRRQLWTRILDALAARGVLALSASIDSTYVKAHRSAHGGKGGESAGNRPLARRPDHQNPRSDGPSGTTGHPAADGRQCRRCHNGSPASRRGWPCSLPDRRQGIRRRSPAQAPEGERSQGCHSRALEPEDADPLQREPLTKADGASRPPSAGSRTSDASPPATTSWPATTSPPSSSPRSSRSGSERVWTLVDSSGWTSVVCPHLTNEEARQLDAAAASIGTNLF